MNEQNELILFDRIEKIKQLNEEYDLEHTSYLSHSGGKDSCVMSVPVLGMGKYQSIDVILQLITKSNYISDNFKFNLKEECDKLNLDYETIIKETDSTGLMEGLYIKVEDGGIVLDRMKYVRYSFNQNIEESSTNWLDRTIIPNKLDKDFYDLF